MIRTFSLRKDEQPGLPQNQPPATPTVLLIGQGNPKRLTLKNPPPVLPIRLSVLPCWLLPPDQISFFPCIFCSRNKTSRNISWQSAKNPQTHASLLLFR